MTSRALITHLIFAALALGFAWRQANAVQEKGGGPSSMVLLDAKAGDVSEVTYTWAKGSSRVSSTGAEAARRIVVDLEREVEPKKDDKAKKDGQEAKSGTDGKPAEETKSDQQNTDGKTAGAEAAPGAASESLPPVLSRERSRFPGGKGVSGALEGLEPLKTRRTLGPVDEERLKAMGLAAPERTLTVTTKSGQTLVLEMGESAYGGQGRYARVKGDAVVHLLEPGVVTGLEGSAESLMEKRILSADVENIEAFAARSGDKEKSFVHLEREQAAKRRFVPKEDPASTETEPGQLITTLRNLRAQKLVADEKSAGSVVASVRVDIEGRGPVGIEVLERADGAGHLVRTEGWTFEISQTQGKELLEDLDAALQ